MNRRAFLRTVSVSLLAAPLVVHAQPPGKVVRLGYLSLLSASDPFPPRAAFRQSLRDLGWIENQNLAIDWRFAEGKSERLPGLATELVRLKVDLIFTETTSAAQAAKQATTTIPIEAQGPSDLDGAFAAMSREKVGGLILLPSAMFLDERSRIVDLSTKNRLPAMFFFKEFADAGGLMSYGPSFPELGRWAATYVDRILKGAKPSDLPVQQPTRFELVVNLKTAKLLKLTIPSAVLLRADHVIE